jgi:ubiquinone/menaquinone biosynthesis C-methylase UbiE
VWIDDTGTMQSKLEHSIVGTPSTTSFGCDRLEKLTALESWHFWFAGRRALVGALLDRHATDDARVVLDVGCGSGATASALASRGHVVVGLDRRDEGIRATRRLLPSAVFLQGDAEAIPLEGESVSIALLLDVLEHVDDAAALAELARVLEPRGVAILTVPAAPWLWSRRDAAAGHRRRYTRASLERAIARAGLELAELRYYQFALFPILALTRLAARRRPGASEAEERPGRALNALLTRVNLAEVRLGERVRYPWGSSLAVVCRKP